MLAGSLSFMSQLGGDAEGRRHQGRTRQVEHAQKIINLGNEAKYFTAYTAYEGEKYVLSIGQVHSDVMLEGTQKGMEASSKNGVQDLIDNQKHIEALLLDLQQNYGVRETYLEDTPSAWSLKLLKPLKAELEASENPAAKLAIVEKAYVYARDITVDCEKGPVLYYLERTLENLEKGDLSDSARKQASSLRERIAADHLIAGDNIYVWGGALKLLAEGKMNIKIADEQEGATPFLAEIEKGGGQEGDEENLMERLSAAKSRAEKLIEEKDFVRKSFAYNNYREDAAISIIAQDADKSTQRFYPLVFGIAHEFTDNVKKYDAARKGTLGLINIYEKPDLPER